MFDDYKIKLKKTTKRAVGVDVIKDMCYVQKRKRFNKRIKMCALAGHPDIKMTSYVIRHSWASIAKGKGVSSDKIGKMMGHDDPKVTQVYLDSFGSEELDEANEMIVGM